MTATRTDAGLLAAILANPADDAPRLVYADWLDEHAGDAACSAGIFWHGACRQERTWGRGEYSYSKCDVCSGSGRVPNDNAKRAEFIRVQVELAKLTRNGEGICACDGAYDPDGCAMCDGTVTALRRRERELWDQIGVGLFNGLGIVWPGTSTKHSLTTKTGFTLVRIGGGTDRAVWSRGFLSDVTTTTVGFMGGLCVWCGGTGGASDVLKCAYGCTGGRALGLAPALFARQPVTTVTLSDAEPWADDLNNERATYRWQWDQREQNEWDGQGTPPWMMGDLPWQLFKLIKRDPHHRRVDVRTGRMARVAMKTFDTFDAAVDALSDACVRWGREQAGLLEADTK